MDMLRLSTDDMGTINIEWSRDRLDRQPVHVRRASEAGGRRYAGVIATSEDGEDLVIRDEVPRSPSPLVHRARNGAGDRVSGSASPARCRWASTTRSRRGIRTGSINISSQYQAERLKATLDISALETSSPDTEPSARENLFSTVQFQRERPSFLMLLNSLERNDELGIDARLHDRRRPSRAISGRIRTARSCCSSGVVANQEWTRRPTRTRASKVSKACSARSWRIFRFNDPETSLSATAYLYPSLTESGRHRGTLDVSLRREIISDLFFDISFYDSYDSDPPSGGEHDRLRHRDVARLQVLERQPAPSRSLRSRPISTRSLSRK